MTYVGASYTALLPQAIISTCRLVPWACLFDFAQRQYCARQRTATLVNINHRGSITTTEHCIFNRAQRTTNTFGARLYGFHRYFIAVNCILLVNSKL